MRKTTIELPEPLFRQVKMLAAREGKTFRSLVVAVLEAEIHRHTAGGNHPDEPYWGDRDYLPEFDRFRRAGAYVGGDSSDALSEERDQR